MVGLWILMAAVYCAVQSEVQHLPRGTGNLSDIGVSEAHQGKTAINHNDKNQGYIMKGKLLRHRHTMLVSEASVEPFQPAIMRKLFNTNAGRRPSNASWALKAANEAAAQMLSRHLAQCLPVVTFTDEEKRFQGVITALDAAGVPRLLLQRRSFNATNRKGESSFLLVLSSPHK